MALIVSQRVLDVGYLLFQSEVPRTTVPPDGVFIGFACYRAVMFVLEKPVLTLPETV